MYNFIIVFIVTNNRLFSRIHFSKIWAHGCIQTGSWRISAFGKTVGRVIVVSCRHLLEVYRLWRVFFQRDIWNFNTRVQTDSWNGSKWRASRRGHGHADIRGKKVTVPHCIITPTFEKWSLGHMPGITGSNQVAADAVSTYAISLTISVLLKYLNVYKFQVWFWKGTICLAVFC